MKKLTKTDKIISCANKLNLRSTAKLCNCSKSYVWNVWHSKCIEIVQGMRTRPNPYKKAKK